MAVREPTPVATLMLAIDRLSPHPKQAAFYNDTNPATDAELARDLELHGQRDPIIVMPAKNAANLPAYTILDGHRRLRLLKAAGKSEVLVQVREDLRDASARDVEQEFLRYNFTRRQLHILDQIKVAERLMELEQRGRRGGETMDPRDRIGKLLGMSGRNLSRYLAISRTPPVVQAAVRRGLNITLAARVALLGKTKQSELAEKLEEVDDIRVIAATVKQFVATLNTGKPKHPHTAMKDFARQLEASMASIQDRTDEVDPRIINQHQGLLTTAGSIIAKLLSRCA